MPSSITSAVRMFLEAPGRFAVVATVRADGRPHQAVVWYSLRGDDLLVNGRAERAWVRAARREGWLSITIADAYDHVVVAGPISAIDEPGRATDDIRALAVRYGDRASDFEGQSRVTILVHPERVVVHGALNGS